MKLQYIYIVADKPRTSRESSKYSAKFDVHFSTNISAQGYDANTDKIINFTKKYKYASMITAEQIKIQLNRLPLISSGLRRWCVMQAEIFLNNFTIKTKFQYST